VTVQVDYKAEAKLRIQVARSTLLVEYPWFGYLAMNLLPKEDESIPTSATDGKYLTYNPKFVAGLECEELKFVVAHEVLHVALHYFERRGYRNNTLWNLAHDFAINLILKEEGLTLPNIALDEKYKGMSAEQIYDTLKTKHEHKRVSKGGNGKCPTCDKACGGVKDPTDETPQQVSERWREYNRLALEEVKRVKGTIPGYLKALIEACEPKIDWRSVLSRFINRVAFEELSYAKPNKNYLYQGIIMPSTRNLVSGDVVVVFDTSGSISDEQLKDFLGELVGIIRGGASLRLHLIQCDAKIQSAETYDSVTDVTIDKMEFKGRGGTSFIPPFKWCEEQYFEPTFLIYLTDGCGDFPNHEPSFPVLWIMSKSDAKPPFGDYCNLE